MKINLHEKPHQHFTVLLIMKCLNYEREEMNRIISELSRVSLGVTPSTLDAGRVSFHPPLQFVHSRLHRSTRGSSGCALNQQQVPPVAVEAAQRDAGLGARVLLQVGAPGDSAGHRCRRRTGRRSQWGGNSCGEGDGHAQGGVTVADHWALALFGLPLLHALDLGLAGFGQPLDRLVLVLLRLLGGLQSSLPGSLLALLHHLGCHLLLLVAHGELQQRLALLLV